MGSSSRRIQCAIRFVGRVRSLFACSDGDFLAFLCSKALILALGILQRFVSVSRAFLAKIDRAPTTASSSNGRCRKLPEWRVRRRVGRSSSRSELQNKRQPSGSPAWVVNDRLWDAKLPPADAVANNSPSQDPCLLSSARAPMPHAAGTRSVQPWGCRKGKTAC